MRRFHTWLLPAAAMLTLLAGCNAPTPEATPADSGLRFPIVTLTPAPTDAAPGATALPAEQAASIIFHNGPILTMNREQPTAEAVAVRGDEILAVGAEDEVVAWRGDGTRVVDLAGKTLMPGFVDSHNHIMNDYNSDRYGETLEERQQVLLRNGITTHANLHTSEDLLAALQDFDDSGQLVVRMGAFLLYNDSCGNPQGDWYLDHPATRARGEHLRIQGVKVFSDGANCGITPAFTVKLAPDTPVPLEPPFVSEDELVDVMVAAQAIGDQVAVHTIGDRAIDLVQAAFARALDGQPNSYRHRIEHNSVVRPDQIPVYSDIDAVLTIFALYPSCNPFGPPIYPEYQDWEWPYQEIIDANPDLHIAWSGDAASFSENPLYQLFGFVTSDDVGADGNACEPRSYLADRDMPVEEALYRMTMESAYSLFREDEVGSLEPGKFADVIALSADPTAVDPLAIKDIEIQMTMIGGETLYCADGATAICP